MKKFTFLLWALILCTRLFAQLPDGSVAPNFTATDLNGNTWNLYDVLDQGKSVVICFSAAWSGPDWNYSNTNILEQYYQLHGPAGDNTSMVFWIEADPTTNVDCLTGGAGCNTGTQGDFTAGKTYPFFDDTDGSLLNAFELNYYPTIFLICSDKLLQETSQVPLVQMELLASACPVVTSTSKLIAGSVVHDGNPNCLVDNGEPALPNWGVTATGQNGVAVSTVSNGNGVFKMWVDSTNAPFTLSFTPPLPLWAVCTPEPVITPGLSDTIYVFHPASAVIQCAQLSAEIGAPFLRRCFNNTFYVEVCNDGSEVATDAYVDITLPSPEFLPLSTASIPYTTIAPGVYRFELSNIEVGECNQFTLTALLSCDSSVIGQTLCFEAHAYPDSLCIPGGQLWNGATVSVNATCNNGQPEFLITNTGTAAMSEQSNYIVIEDDVMGYNGSFQLNPGESISVPVPNNGSTWRVEALQVPNHPIAGNPSAALEGCTVQNSFSMGYLLNFPVYDPSPAQDIECLPVIGSWDPNDKAGFPTGVTSENLIGKNTDIDYLIRFQNTGNDTAFTVVVRDTLSSHLNPSAMRLGASSHPYDYVLEQGNIMVFTFNNIKLVDSFTNEPASHGFLRFKIAQKPDLPDGTDIYNQAAIYFDFNEPVLTNTTHHRIGEVAHVSVISTDMPEAFQLSVYPNPLRGDLLLHTREEMPAGSTWKLYDFSGKQIGSGLVNGNTASIGHYLKYEGLYHIEFRTKAGTKIGGATIKN